MALSLGPISDKKYPVTRSYAAHPKVGCPGPDIGYPIGIPLKAVVDGIIVSGVNPDIPGRIDPIEDWGKYIWLTYAKNKRIKFGYGHLSKFRVRSGSVKKGQVIAYSGNSGYSFGSHLHFAFSYYGRCIDPFNSPNVVQWTKEEEVTPKEAKLQAFIEGYAAITNKHSTISQRNTFLKSGQKPRAYLRNKIYTPQINKLKKRINSLKNTVATQAHKINKQKILLQEADIRRAELNSEVAKLADKVTKLEERLLNSYPKPKTQNIGWFSRFTNWVKGVRIG
jgi:hypothetical protein